MYLLKIVLHNEWRQFCRQGWMLASLSLFILVAALSIGAGNQKVHSKFVQIDSMEAVFQRDVELITKKFSDTLTTKGKEEAKNAGLAAMINYRLSPTAIKKPMPLAALSIGLMDIQPWYQQVKYTNNFNDQSWAPVTNPVMLLAGNFDYSFVLVYLLPMLVLAFCHSVYSIEVEAGTVSLLAIQAGGIKKVIFLKLLFRFLLIGIVLTVLNTAGFLFSTRESNLTINMIICWILLTWIYLFFWITIAHLALSMRKNGMSTALTMTSIWLLLLIIIPSVINSYLQVKYPLPLQDEIASYRRHQSEEIWESSAKILSDSFNRYNPQYAASADPAKDTLPHSIRYIAGYYDLLQRRMERKLQPYNEQLNLRNAVAQKLLRWNPAFLCEFIFNTISGNHLIAYRDFNVQVNQYQRQWQEFLYPFHLDEKKLSPEDFRHLPVFNYKPAKAGSGNLLLLMIYILLVSVILLVCAGIIEKKQRSFR